MCFCSDSLIAVLVQLRHALSPIRIGLPATWSAASKLSGPGGV